MVYNKLKNMLARLFSDRAGNIAITFSLALVPVMFTIGAAVDYSRYSRGFSKMTFAGDTAIFAASKKMTGSGETDDTILQTELEAEFDKFMSANFDADKFGIEYTRDLDFDRDAQTVTVEIAGTQETAFLKAVGKDTLIFKETLGTRLETTPENYVMDIVMCIDATGSMQSTLNSVQASAATFDAQLRTELNIEANDPRFKVRIRPIYFRDWEDASSGSGSWEYTPWTWVYGSYYHWRWGTITGWHWEGGWTWVAGEPDLENGLKPADDFFDLDDATDSTAFQTFLNSESASGGGNLPEASGACMNEGMRSDWYDRTETTDFATDENVTVFPILVIWTDAAIRDLTVTQQLSSTQPTTYDDFEDQWEDPTILPQNPKLMILFGPQTYAGWNTVRYWDNYEYGGSIYTGNSSAISVIADNIIKALPDVLRLTN